MDIYIVSSGRATWAQQHTARALTHAGIDYVLVVQEREYAAYSEIETWGGGHMHTQALPESISTLAATRDWIVHSLSVRHDTSKILMFDDDLQFARRRADDHTKFVPMKAGDLAHMIHGVATLLGDYPMVGIAPREGANRQTDIILPNTRIMRAMGLDCAYIRAKGYTFTPLEMMEDFHMNLQILEGGQQTCVLNSYVTNQAGGSNAPGGCSTYRTPALQAASARLLAARHPGVVKVVQKKGWQGEATRDDVIVSWKSAYLRSQK